MNKVKMTKGMDCSQCPLYSVCLPFGLDKLEIESLNKIISRIRVVPKKEHAFYANNKMQNLYAIHKGTCKEYWIDEEGNERINNFYFPGDIIGIESVPLRKHMFYVSALDDVELCVIPIDKFFELMQISDNLLKRFFNLTSYKIHNEYTSRMSTTASQRLCDFVVGMINRLKERNICDNSFELVMSQLEISNYLGISSETVNRILNQLKRNKIIKIKNKKIYILQKEQLEKMSTIDKFILRN